MPDSPYDTTSLAQGISKGIDENVRTYQNGKIADSIVRTNPEMLDQLGMTKEQFGSLSATDRASTVTGAITAIGMKQQAAAARSLQMEQAARAQYFQGAANWRDAQAGAKEDPQAAEDRFNLMLQQALGGGPGAAPGGTPAGGAPASGPAGMMPGAAPAPAAGGGDTTLSPQQLMMMMTKSGMNPQQEQQHIANLRMMGIISDQDTVQEDPATGARYLPGKGGQPVILGYNPKTAAAAEHPIQDADGNILGVGMFDPKSGRTKITKANDAATDSKASMAAQLEGEKALTEIDNHITEWQNNAAKKDGAPGKLPVDKDQLTRLQARRERLYNMLNPPAKTDVARPGGAAGGPAQPQTKADFDKLKSGDMFINPADGKVMKKK